MRNVRVIVSAVLVATALTAGAIGALARPAAATTADTGTSTIDRISVSAARGMDRRTIVAVERAAIELGAQTTIIHQGVFDLTRVTRGGSLVQTAPQNMGYPMSTEAVDPLVIGQTMGQDVADTTGRGQIVMSDVTASIRGAQTGDQVTLVGWNKVVFTLTIGLIVPESRIGGSEIVMARYPAALMGMDRPSTVRVWGFGDRDNADAILASHLAGILVRIRHSWDSPSVDDQISDGRTKLLVGEFAVARGPRGQINQDRNWQVLHLVQARLPIIGSIRCNSVVADALGAVMQEVSDAGLGGLINVSDTRRYGGCWNAREVRTDTGTSGRNLSRHTWGAAVDINPSTNRFGGVSHMDQRVIDIFHRHGFIWGGGFIIADPMHFEFVGEPRV